jgi:hypothetical protein
MKWLGHGHTRWVVDPIPCLLTPSSGLFPINPLPSPTLKVMERASGCFGQRFISKFHFPSCKLVLTTHKPGRLQPHPNKCKSVKCIFLRWLVSASMIFTRIHTHSLGLPSWNPGHFKNSFSTAILWKATATGMLRSTLAESSPLLMHWMLKARAVNWLPCSWPQKSPRVILRSRPIGLECALWCRTVWDWALGYRQILCTLKKCNPQFK